MAKAHTAPGFAGDAPFLSTQTGDRAKNNETASEQTAKANEVPANNLFNMFETMKEVLTQERYKDKSIMKMKL